MGFFSWECESCRVSLRSAHATEDPTQIQCTVILSDNSVVHGEYDGYGRINGEDIMEGKPTCYHTTCWERAGRPTEYFGESNHAQDQGYFFDEKELI